MNSWLGGGLSSLKGQLSHLITEGTEEVSDSSLEIETANKKVSQLESEIKSAYIEINDLKEKNNDLYMKLQSEEMLLESVSQSYQEKLKQKEEIIESLTNKLMEEEHRCDHFKSEEVIDLRNQVVDLTQQVSKWKALSDSNQTDAFEITLYKLLEEQKQQLDLDHSNIILELQREHSKQLHYLNQETRKYYQSVSEEDFSNCSLPDGAENVEKSVFQKSFHDISIQTSIDMEVLFENNSSSPYHSLSHVVTSDQINDLVELVSDKIIKKEASLELILEKIRHFEKVSGMNNADDIPLLSPGIFDERNRREFSDGILENQSSLKFSSQYKNVIADSLSQVSDISEVSIKSKILEEQVRNLSNQISKYEKQFVGLEESPISNDIIENVDKISSKIRKLKVNLSQTKVVLESRFPESLEEDSNLNIMDSWENSSNNSLVEEQNIELHEPLNSGTIRDNEVRDLYGILFPEHLSEKEINVLEMLQSIREAITEIVENKNLKDKLEEQLIIMYNDLNFSTDLEAPTDILDILKILQDNVKIMKETCSVHEYILEENKSLQERISELQCKISSLKTENCELSSKNTELDGQMIDMSITIARYEDLEKICDKYQKQISAMSKQTEKESRSMDSDDILEHVETFNQEKDDCIQSLESKIVSFQNLCEEKDDYINNLKQRESDIIYEYDSTIEVLKSELDSVRNNLEKNLESELEYKKQVTELHEQILEKDKMIESLNQEMTMLSVIDIDNFNPHSKMKTDCMDEFSQTEYEINGPHFSDMERQISCLVLENQRLEQVLEAQASSISQYEMKVNCLVADNSRLTKLSNTNDEVSSEDMTKETLHHLSKMIRDKEWEIEALKSKNDSLCSIIKNYNKDGIESPNFSYIESILNEKESLSKELIWYQENREQLISALNNKHKESLNYHGEIQRLISYINTEQSKWNDLLIENERLNEQIKTLTSESASNEYENAKKPVQELVDVGVSFSTDSSLVEESAFLMDTQYKQLKEQYLSLEKDCQQKSSENRSLLKQIEQISFELEKSHLQISELTKSFSCSQQQLEYCQTELANRYNDITASPPVESAKDIWKTKYQQDSDDSEKNTLDSRENLHQQLCRKQLECDNYASQIEQLKARENKLLKEKQIFQDHLIRIEESYTQEATLAEDREQVLRKQLHLTEDNLQAANDEIAKLQHMISNVRKELYVELNAIKLERDELKNRLKDTEKLLEEHMKSVNNLQMVLDNFQIEQTSEMSYQKERFQQEQSKVTEERNKLERLCMKLQRELDDQRELVDAAQRLSDQIEHKDDQLAEIQATLAKKEELIDSLKMEIRKLNTFTESKVDKVLMKNLVIGYFHTPQHRRQEALKVIGSLLQFSDGDYNQIGIDTANKSRWFSWLRPTSGDKTSMDQNSEIMGKSFSELFISFLEKESTPMPQMKLPTKQLVETARQHSSLSQSYEYPYTNSTSASSVIDPHKFFSHSPVITKRSDTLNNDAKQKSTNPESRDPPPLLIPTLMDINSTAIHRESRDSSISKNHKRSESSRNALLSLLDQ